MIGPALRGLTLLLSLALVALAGGFFWFAAIAGQVRAPPPRAGGIVALTGGADRVETALHLLAAGRADLLLVSGVAHGGRRSTPPHSPRASRWATTPKPPPATRRRPPHGWQTMALAL